MHKESFFKCTCPVVQALFDEQAIFTPLYCLCSFLKTNLMYLWGSISGPSFLFHCSILRSPFCLETWLNQSLTAAVGWTAPSIFWVCSLPHTWASTSRCPERAWATHPAGVDFHSSVPWEPCSYLLIATCSPCTLPSSGRSYSVRKLHSGVSKLGSLAAWRGWTPSGVLASLHHEVPMVTEILCWVKTAAAPLDE